jgi:hypothetical protein
MYWKGNNDNICQSILFKIINFIEFFNVLSLFLEMKRDF